MSKTHTTAAVQRITDRQELLKLPKGQLVDLVFILREQLALLQARVAALEKNSTNSSKPPSSDLPGAGSSTVMHDRNSRQSSDRKSGGQPGHTGTTRELVDNPDTVIVCAPDRCEGCGSSLPGSVITDEVMARSQVVDIPPIVPVVTEYRAVALRCACGHITTGQLPTAVAAQGTVHIGTNASSLLVYLNTAHHLPYQRLQHVAADLFNLRLSQGSIANKLEQAAIAAAPLQQTILNFLQTSPHG